MRQGLLRDVAALRVGSEKERRLKNGAAVSARGGNRLFGGRMGP